MDAVEQALASLQPAWRAACEAHLNSCVPGYSQKPQQEKLKLLLHQCLHSNFNFCGPGTLPPGVQDLHATQLRGRFLLQLDEVINIAATARQRYTPGGGHRCLKVLLTDGVQQVAGLEYQFIPALSPFVKAGTKVLVYDPRVRRGVLLLTPGNLVMLGGQVDELEQARQRMVEHWNQPAVGRRGPPAQIQEVIQQATAAAWSSHPTADGAQQQQQQQPPGLAAQHQQQPPGLPAQQQQQQQSMGPQPALAALRQAPAAQQAQRPLLQLPQPRPAQPPAAQFQQQQQQHGPGHPGAQGPGASFGAAQQQQQQYQQQQQQQQQQYQQQQYQQQQQLQQQHQGGGSAGPPSGQGFSFAGQAAGPMQHNQSNSLQGGAGGRAQQQGALPLQPANGISAASGAAKRSRLQLRQHAQPADFSFVQPSGTQQQQQQQQQQPKPAGPPAAQQQQAAPLNRAAGTVDDPIVICSPEAPRQQQRQQQQQELQNAAEDPVWNDDWDEPPEEGHALEPYEMGFNEQFQEIGGEALDPAGIAPEEGDQDWGEERAGEEEEVEEEEWSEEGEGAQQGQPQGLEEAGAEEGVQEEETQEALWDAAMEDADAGASTLAGRGVEELSSGGQAVSQPAGPAAAPTLSALQGPGQPAAARPAEHSRQPSLQPATAHLSGDEGEGQASAKAGSGARKRPLVMSDSDSEAPRRGMQQQQQRRPPEIPAAAAPAAARGPPLVEPRRGATDGNALPAAPGLDGALQLEPLDDDLLQPAPSLLDLLPKPPAATAPPAVAAPVAATTAAAPHSSLWNGSKAGGASTAALHRMGAGGRPVSGGKRPLLLRPSLRAGSAAATPLPAQARSQPLEPPDLLVMGDSDTDDSGVFHGLVEEEKPASAKAVPGSCCEEQPFTHLCLLSKQAAAAGPAEYPITASIFGLVKTMVGKLNFTNPQTGEPQYNVEMVIEDGTFMCNALLGHQFLQEFFDCSPQELQRQLGNKATQPAALELVKALQGYLAQYTGLMRVQLPGPGKPLEVLDLGGALSPLQAAALQSRAMS